MKRLVYTSFDEDPGPKNRTAIWAQCKDSVMAWVDRMGAELVNQPKPEGYQPQWVIYDCFKDSIERNEDVRCIWIDCDIFVTDHAPDLFELPDRHYYCQPDPVRRLHPRMRKNWVRYGAVNPRPYVVSALVMWSPRHVERMVEWFDNELERENPRFGRRDGDQELLTVSLQESETAMCYFPPDLHKMSRHIRSDTPFMHAAGKRKGKKVRKFKLISDRYKRLHGEV